MTRRLTMLAVLVTGLGLLACGSAGAGSDTAPAEIDEIADTAGADAPSETADVPPLPDVPPDAPPADTAQEVLTDPLLEHGLIVDLDAIPCLDWDTQTPEADCNHHGSSVIVQPDGTVLATWYHGKGEKSKDSRLLWAKKPKGGPWQPWAVLFDDPGRAEGNPTIWRSERTGELVVFFVTLHGDSWDDGILRAIRSADDGATWSAPVTLREELAWMTRNKPIRLASGELLLPTYDEALYCPSFLISADDFVADWIEIPFEGVELVKHPHQIQPTVIQRADGTIFAMLRNTNPVVPQVAWEMTSVDDARSWTKATASVIPNSSASLEMIQARRGVVALTFNNSVTGRCPLAVALSDDEGRTWSAVANVLDDCLASGGSYGYPSIAEDPTDGSFWVTYTHDRRTIGWVHVTEAWIRAHPAPLAKPPASWGALEDLAAPDRETLTFTFTGEPDAAAAATPGAYVVTSDQGPLDVLQVTYDPAKRAARLTTAPQKLGVTYTVTVTPTTGEPPTGSVLSALTARFWVSDPDDPEWSQIHAPAHRVAAGEHAVIYALDGEGVEDADALAAEFDQLIYPILTTLFPGPPDLDGNGRIVIVAVQGDFGGYFSPLNQYPESLTLSRYGLHSNEMELLHLNPAIGGWAYGTTLAHELQHLLYHAQHGLVDGHWEYHNEGLSECAVHVVYGANEMAVQMFQWDPSGLIGQGLSLVHWTYAQYENYALAYLFWTYVMAQLGEGLPGYRRIFDVPSGSPEVMSSFLEDALGASLPITHLLSLAALWTQSPTGAFGYRGTLPALGPGQCPTAPTGTTSLALEPFSGAFFPLAQSPVDYPGTEGQDILYVGLGEGGTVDQDAPFDVAGGALLVYNRAFEWDEWTTEPSGPGLPARPTDPWYAPLAAARPRLDALTLRPDWSDPPPLLPDRSREWSNWRSRARR